MSQIVHLFPLFVVGDHVTAATVLCFICSHSWRCL